MDDACRSFQSLWLEGALDPGALAQRDSHLPHVKGCEACEAWVGEAHAQVTAIGQLAWLAAPPELDALVFPLRRDETPQPLCAQVVRDLPGLSAPSVLDRLVEEELADPERVRARRFAGDLERRDVPAALERRVFRLLPGERTRRRLAVPLVGLAAAAVVVWLGFSSLLQRDTRRERPFTVHEGRPETISPLVAGLTDAWTGGPDSTQENR